MGTVTTSAKETKRLGRKIAVDVVKTTKDRAHSAKGSVIFALTGELGSGKTTFVQGFAKGLGIKQRIISPTFIIMRNYRIKLKAQSSKLKTETKYLKYTNFYHVDLYRLEDNFEQEIANLGLKEIWSDPKNVVAIEWAEKIKDMIPKSAHWIKFKNLGGDKRRIV
jgi:tRNA threonylcarbamoyladenosine biosynthesis protein TsaE